MQRRRPTWCGNSLVESRTGASAAQNKVPSLYYSLYYSPAPFPLEPIFTPKGAEREKGSGGGKKNLWRSEWGGSSFLNPVLRGSGVQLAKHLPCWSVYLFRDLPSEAAYWKVLFTISFKWVVWTLASKRVKRQEGNRNKRRSKGKIYPFRWQIANKWKCMLCILRGRELTKAFMKVYLAQSVSLLILTSNSPPLLIWMLKTDTVALQADVATAQIGPAAAQNGATVHLKPAPLHNKYTFALRVSAW